MDLLNNPLMVPILGIVFGSAMIVGIVAIAHWHKVREKELQYHQEYADPRDGTPTQDEGARNRTGESEGARFFRPCRLTDRREVSGNLSMRGVWRWDISFNRQH